MMLIGLSIQFIYARVFTVYVKLVYSLKSALSSQVVTATWDLKSVM